MEIIEIATMSSKGQVTVPASIRDVFNLGKGSTVIFKLTDRGVFFMPCEITERKTYTREEWGKIEQLVSERGRKFKTAEGAREHFKSL